MAESTHTVTNDESDVVTSADGTTIAFDRSGNGPPLVLVYGTGDVTGFWDGAGIRSALAKYCTVYVIERRGRGASGDGAEYALEREAEDVAAVVDAIDEPVTLLGHSAGALYSLEAALRTDNVRKLILYEPPIGVAEHGLDVEAGVRALEQLLNDGEAEQALVLLLQEFGQLTQEDLNELRSAPIWSAMVEAAHTLPRELHAIREYEFDAVRFADLVIPTLLLTGSESPPLYSDAISTVDDALPNTRIVHFEGEQHMAMHTAPDRFIDEVLAFIRESK